MQIITKLLTLFTTPVIIIIYGPNEIPYGHFLFGRSLFRHGTYTRELVLSNKLTLRFIIFRFREILPSGSEYKSITYSLLPFYISPYQRHINTTIDTVLEKFFLNKKSKFSISQELDIGIVTVRRWISKFSDRAKGIKEGIEKMMINSKPGYRAATYPINNISQLVRSIFHKVFQLAEDKNILLDYGVVSWLNLKFQF